MGFAESLRTCFGKYAKFDGRASRPEFWYFYLFCFIYMFVAGFLLGIVGASDEAFGVATLVLLIPIFIPGIAVAARRLHDIGKSGWWQLIVLTGIGVILLIAWWASKPVSVSYSKKIQTEKTSSKSKLAEELRELKELYNDGTLSKEEFTKAKNKLLK